MRITIPREQPREIAPPGSHDATCYCIADLGTQTTQYGAKRQIYIAWKLPDEKTTKGRPHALGKFYNLVSDARGNLRQDLESWLGRVLQDNELCEIDLCSELIGRTATLGVAHDLDKNSRPRAVVTSVMLPRRGVPQRTQTLNAPMAFGLEDGFDKAVYDILPEWLRGIITRSPEYKQAIAPDATKGTTAERLKRHLGNGEEDGSLPRAEDDLDDDIPF
jgi:hypothetical protein